MMVDGVFVYISGPISPNVKIVEENVAEAVVTFLELTRLRIASFCPHLTALLPSAHKMDYKLWMEYDIAVIDRCTHMLMLPRWRESKGAVEERIYAAGKGIPVVFSIKELVDSIQEQINNTGR